MFPCKRSFNINQIFFSKSVKFPSIGLKVRAPGSAATAAERPSAACPSDELTLSRMSLLFSIYYGDAPKASSPIAGGGGKEEEEIREKSLKRGKITRDGGEAAGEEGARKAAVTGGGSSG